MRAVGVREFGGPEQLEVLDVARPEPGAGEVRIRVYAATVNPTDTVLRAGLHRTRDLEPPYIPGMDAAGVIEAVGDGTTWRVGDRVIAVVVPILPRGGAYADEIVVPARSVAPMPSGTEFAEASTLPMNALTARLTLDKLALPVGSTLAVTGAAGAFGGYVVQLARAEGLYVIADASEADEELIRRLGANEVVRRGKDVAERIREVAPDGVDGLADGAVLDDLAVPAIRDGGGLAVVRGWRGEPGRDITVHRVLVVEAVTDFGALDRLRRQVEEGVLDLRVARLFPAEEAAKAHRLLEGGGVRGRLVLDFAS